MEKLKIGDKVCLINDTRWTGLNYYFDHVVRITKTQAVLNSGKKLINEPLKGDVVKFSEYGDRWTKWQMTTSEIIGKANQLNYERKIDNWFSNHKFTKQQKEQIYLLIHKDITGI